MTRRRSSFSLVAGVILAAGCGGALPPPPAPPEAASSPPLASVADATVAPAPPVVPAPAPSAAPAAKPPPAAPRPPAEPLLPLTRPFVTVTLPGVAGELVSVGGRSSRDLWFLSDETFHGKQMVYWEQQGVLIHSDGKRVIRRIQPDCMGGMFTSIQVEKRGLVLSGANPYIRGPSTEVAFLDEDGSGACLNEWLTVHVTPGDAAWKLECRSMQGHACVLHSDEGQHARLPSYHASFGKEGDTTPIHPPLWEMRSETDGWMVLDHEDGASLALYRYNGVTWAPVATLPYPEVTGMWVEDEGRVWITGAGAVPPLRFDGRSLVTLPAPESFQASIVVGTGPRDVWFLGAGRRVYQWDGSRLYQGEAPFAVGEAWAAPGGEVFVVGHAEGGPGKGVMAHTAKPGEAH